MLIPVSDENEDYDTPWVNMGIMLACFAVYAYQLTLTDRQLDEFFRSYGFVSGDYFDALRKTCEQPCTTKAAPFAAYAALSLWGKLKAVTAAFFDPFGTAWLRTLFSTFMHGGVVHIAGNMFFLWIFGDNVEHVMGRARYWLFFLLTGFLSQYAQTLAGGPVDIPCIGASGAISAVMGAYLVYYPRAVINVWFIPVDMHDLWVARALDDDEFRISARAYLLFFIAVQLFAGFLTWGTDYLGVAIWAHIGGFGFGWLLARYFRDPEMMYMEDADKAFGSRAPNEYFFTFRGRAVHRRPMMEERIKKSGAHRSTRRFGWVKRAHAGPYRKTRHKRPHLSDMHGKGRAEAARRKRLGSDWMKHDKE